MKYYKKQSLQNFACLLKLVIMTDKYILFVEPCL